jgi:hypothetical protein
MERDDDTSSSPVLPLVPPASAVDPSLDRRAPLHVKNGWKIVLTALVLVLQDVALLVYDINQYFID